MRCSIQRRTPVSFRASRTRAPKAFEKTSISNSKRSDSKMFIYGRLDKTIDLNRQRLFFRPRLRHVLNAWLTDVTDQRERQSVCVRPAELVSARALAGFGDRPDAARFLNCDCIGCDRIVAPDLCLWLRSHDMKCAVG